MALNNMTTIDHTMDVESNLNESVLNANMIYYNNHELREEREETQTVSINPTEVGSNRIDNVHILISNVTASFNVQTHLDLRHLARIGCNVEYARDQGKLMMKLRKPKTLANIWSKGKIMCVGCSSEYEAKIAARRVARIIQKLGYPEVKFNNYRVANILAVCTLPFPVKIVPFSEKYKANAQYEPELNPGVTYKIKELKATLKIFSTGKISVHAGSEALVRRAVEHIFPLIWPFRRDNHESNVQPLMTINGIQTPEQNAELMESTEDRVPVYRRPGGEFVGNCQLNTMVL